MALAISPLMLALVVIIGVELIVVILSICYLLWRGRAERRSDKSTDLGNYGNTKKLSSSVSSVHEDDEACIVENEVVKIKPTASSQASSNPSPHSDDEKVPISTSISFSSSKGAEEDPALIEDHLSEENASPIEAEDLQKQEDDDQEQGSRRSSTSSSQSSSSQQSSSSSSSSSSSAQTDEEPTITLKDAEPLMDEMQQPAEPIQLKHELHKSDSSSSDSSASTSSTVPEQQVIQAPQNLSPEPRTQSFDLGGITLSLRIESKNMGQSVQVNGEEIARPESDSSFTSSDSEMEYQAAGNESDDNIQVIRRYEMPANEQILYNSGPRQIDERDISNEVLSSDGESEVAIEKNEEGEETVAGIINVTTGERLTICQAVKNGLIPRKTALLLLEAQAATGSVVNPRNGVKLSVSDAVSLGIVDEEYQRTLVAAEGAYYGYMDPRTGENISLSTAMNREIFPKHQGLRLLEAQMATGGIIDPWTGSRHSLSNAVSRGLIDRKTASQLKNRVKQTEFFDPSTRNRLGYADLLSKCIRDLDTGMKFLYIEEKPKNIDLRYQPELLTFRSAFRRKVTLQELIEVGLVENSTLEAFQSGRITKEELRDILQPFLVGENPIAGILNKTTNKIRTICQAVQEGTLRRSTAIELLEAQAATGSMLDPYSGKKMSLSKALSLGLVDSQFGPHLKRAEQAVQGYTEPGTKRMISLFEAMKRGIVIENHGIRMLEAQIATGGVIDPEAGYRIPTSMALEKGLFDERMSQILFNTNHDMRGYFDPNTGDNLTYGELMQRCVLKRRKYGSLLLLPIHDKVAAASAVHQPPQRHRSGLRSNSSDRKMSSSSDE